MDSVSDKENKNRFFFLGILAYQLFEVTLRFPQSKFMHAVD